MKKFNALLSASALSVAVFATPAQALIINLNNVNNISTASDAYKGFRAAADFWQSVISTNVTLTFNIGFSNLGSTSIIGQTSSTAFQGVLVEDVYGQMAATGKSRLDKIAGANLSPLTQVNSIYGGTTGAVSAITQQAANSTNNTGIKENTRANNPNFTGTAANAIGLNGIETASFREWDNDGSRNNYDLRANSSVLKALGYNLPNTAYSCANRVNTAACNADPTHTAGGAGIDAKVTFNSTFAFDFDPSDGIGEGKIDFIGTAIHEFGHGLGFVSGVDIWDNPANANSAAVVMDLNPLQSTLDLFRYSDDVTGVAPGTGQVLDWSVGNSATATDNLNGRAYFSFDGHNKGLSAYGGDEGYFSTGANYGDGRQTSHFMDTPYAKVPGSSANLSCNAPIVPSRGIMDPTFSGCELGHVTSLDLAAFDAMGWNLKYDVLSSRNVGKVFTSRDAFLGITGVPEPTLWAQFIAGFGFIGAAFRRLRRRGGKLATA
jgi:hypothetical protein